MSNNDSSQINPAWNEILNAVPEALHGVLIPALQKWDAGVTQKFQEIHSQYEPLKAYKALADNGIDPEYAQNAVILADRMQSNPKQIAEQLNQAYNLGYLSPEQAATLQKPGSSQNNSGDPDDDFFDGSDITKHPQFKMIADQIAELKNTFEQTNQQQQEQQQIAEFEEYLDTLEAEVKEKKLPFNRRYVTALMTQGLDGEAAVKQYHQDLAIESLPDPNANPPVDDRPGHDLVVMGQAGSTGGGTPDNSVRMGDLSTKDTNQLVVDLLNKQAESGQ